MKDTVRRSDDSNNQRRMRRHYLIYYLRVFDRDTGAILGHLVDITPKGIMILRDSPIEVGNKYSLRLRWRNSVGRLQVAEFEGECKWCRPDVNPDFYGAGFAISAASDEHVKAIAELIGDLKMPDPV
ncbi:MAG: PilZ domain-containing protein [Planctomycetota bacterium]|nr:PilZ domain-containing protein [Planctomycetota bacterium]